MVKSLPVVWETWGWEVPLVTGMATHSSILAWRIPTDRGAWWVTGHRVTKSGHDRASNSHRLKGALQKSYLMRGKKISLKMHNHKRHQAIQCLQNIGPPGPRACPTAKLCLTL